MSEDFLIIGIGNRQRGDDGIGSLIAQHLRNLGYKNVIDAEYTPENYLNKIIELKPKKIIFVDACDFKAKPGEFRLFSKKEWARTRGNYLSTHTLPLSIFLYLIEKEVGCEIYLLGIQIKQTEFNSELSLEVKNSFPAVIKFLIDNFIMPNHIP